MRDSLVIKAKKKKIKKRNLEIVFEDKRDLEKDPLLKDR